MDDGATLLLLKVAAWFSKPETRKADGLTGDLATDP